MRARPRDESTAHASYSSRPRRERPLSGAQVLARVALRCAGVAAPRRVALV